VSQSAGEPEKRREGEEVCHHVRRGDKKGELTLLASARTRLHGATSRHDEGGVHLQMVHAQWLRHNCCEGAGEGTRPPCSGKSGWREMIRGFFF
jgi:hypothetical protein